MSLKYNASLFSPCEMNNIAELLPYLFVIIFYFPVSIGFVHFTGNYLFFVFSCNIYIANIRSFIIFLYIFVFIYKLFSTIISVLPRLFLLFQLLFTLSRFCSLYNPISTSLLCDLIVFTFRQLLLS